MSSFFPLFVDVSRFKIVVIGGGRIAERRIQTLQQFGAHVTVIAPEITDSLAKLAKYGQICWLRREYKEGDFSDPEIGMAVVATNDRMVNQQAGMEARLEGVPVSVADCKEESTFYFPGVAHKGNIVVGVTASGLDHKEAARVTQNIRMLLEEE